MMWAVQSHVDRSTEGTGPVAKQALGVHNTTKLTAEATMGIWSTFRIKHYISTKIGNRDQTKKNFGNNLHEIIGNCCTEQCYLLAK